MTPSRSAICVMAVGTKIEPAHCPMIEMRYTSDMTVVRRLYLSENRAPNASFIDGFLFASSSAQRLDSLTLDMIHPTKSAGTPPNANIQRHP